MKKKRLFYYEDTVDAWCPAPLSLENIVSVDMLDEGEVQEIQFKCLMMSDAEMEALPVV